MHRAQGCQPQNEEQPRHPSSLMTRFLGVRRRIAPGSQVKSVEEADKRIDELASSGKLDPALMLTMAKAYSASKDTDFTREEVKDVMAHLYFKVRHLTSPKPYCTGSYRPPRTRHMS